MQHSPAPDAVAKKVVELHGGAEQCREALDSEIRLLQSMWTRQDIEAIGRVLRAHLIVEHFLGAFLAHVNPNLGPIENARLTFSQKAELLGTSEAHLAMFLPGIRQLNKIRNRLAHNLSVTITEDDKAVFLNVWPFSALRTELAKPGKPSDDPLDIAEEFARHVASHVQSVLNGMGEVFGRAVAEALKDAEQGSQNTVA